MQNLKNTVFFHIIFSLFFCTHAYAATFYVSPPPTGSDVNAGTSTAPFATISRAITAVKGVDKAVAGTTVVTINKGTYLLTQPLLINDSAGGSAVHRVIYKAADGDAVLISGGITASGWTQAAGKPYYQTSIIPTEVRDLYVAGERRTRARTNAAITGIGWSLSGTTRQGILIDQVLLPFIAHPEQVELHMQSDWRDAYVPVQSISLVNGAWDLRSNRINEASSLNPESAAPNYARRFYVENAIELLDQPDEWCFDRTSKTLYYYPKVGENIATLEVIVPVCERLLDIAGSSLADKVRNIRIEGLRFANTAWNAPSNEGWFGWQSESLARPANTAVPAAIRLNNATGVTIYNCQVRNTAAAGLALPNGVSASRIEGCYFFDIGDAAVLVSTTEHNAIDATGEEVCTNDTIVNNLIVRAGAAFRGAPGISAFYTDGLVIDHNTLMELPYSGISLGWDWSNTTTTCKNNRISANRIDGYLSTCRDGGGIYTLGNQPNSLVENNYLSHGYNDFAGLYFDEGSSFFTVRNNVIDVPQYWLYIWTPLTHDISLSSNWSTTLSETQKGTNITYQAPTLVTNSNWPTAAQTIIDGSGFSASLTGLTALLPLQSNVPPAVTISGSASIAISLIDKLIVNATVTDDGKPAGVLRTLWRKKSGPGTVSFPTAEEFRTLVSFSVAGTYTLECMASDLRDSSSATLQVVVSEATLGTNLALNKPANASSSYGLPQYGPAMGNDGNVNTIWAPATWGDSWWSVDLGSSVAIGRLELEGRRGLDQSDARRFFRFEGSNDSFFNTSIVLGGQDATPFDFEGTWSCNVVPPVSCKYLRMSKTVQGLGTLTELRVFDVKGTTVSTIRDEYSPNPRVKLTHNSGSRPRYVLLPLGRSRLSDNAVLFDLSGRSIGAQTRIHRSSSNNLRVLVTKEYP